MPSPTVTLHLDDLAEPLRLDREPVYYRDGAMAERAYEFVCGRRFPALLDWLRPQLAEFPLAVLELYPDGAGALVLVDVLPDDANTVRWQMQTLDDVYRFITYPEPGPLMPAHLKE